MGVSVGVELESKPWEVKKRSLEQEVLNMSDIKYRRYCIEEED